MKIARDIAITLPYDIRIFEEWQRGTKFLENSRVFPFLEPRFRGSLWYIASTGR